MRYRVEHTTTFAYGNPVELASHMVHLLPRDLPYQRVLSSELLSEPVPGRRSDARDHFGNRVSWLFMDAAHQRFDVTLRAEVAVEFPAPPAPEDTPPWEEIATARDGGQGQWQAAEFVFQSPMVAADPDVAAYVARSFPAGRRILVGVIDLLDRINHDFRFQAGITTIATPVGKVLAQKAGVCQDFSHLMISGLRGLGIPARYVSGYIRTRPPPGQIRRRGADQSHAWVGVWLGPAFGWIDVDPTNNLIVHDEHVVLGWGRDYGDLSPVRGVILGGGTHSLSVSVDLEALQTR
jgi:transglutaminase-like putative cysteine protease